jgi:hypothetical protein
MKASTRFVSRTVTSCGALLPSVATKMSAISRRIGGKMGLRPLSYDWDSARCSLRKNVEAPQVLRQPLCEKP